MLDNSNDNNTENLVENDNMTKEVIENFEMPEKEEVKEESSETVKKEKKFKLPKNSASGNSGFLTFLAAAASDVIISGVATFIILFVVDFLMRHILGYEIVKKADAALIFYAVISIVYVSIMHNKMQATVGEKVFGLKVSKN